MIKSYAEKSYLQLELPYSRPPQLSNRRAASPRRVVAAQSSDNEAEPRFGEGMDPTEWGEIDAFDRTASLLPSAAIAANTASRTARDQDATQIGPDPRMTFLRWQDPDLPSRLHELAPATGTALANKAGGSAAELQQTPGQLAAALNGNVCMDVLDVEEGAQALEDYHRRRAEGGNYMAVRIAHHPLSFVWVCLPDTIPGNVRN